MKIDSLEVNFHRTVRVQDGRVPSSLPPSLGRMVIHPVSQYRKQCPKSWSDDSCFVALHDVEAMWMSFHPQAGPCAVLVGAGGVNALTGKKLGTVLQQDNYLVCPPQPWLDGWKDKDGTVYQFVATPHKKGKGKTVAEQLIGTESQTGAIGISVFAPKDRNALKSQEFPQQTWAGSPWSNTALLGESTVMCTSVSPSKSEAKNLLRSNVGASASFSEMGVGKGGKIIQKIYPDPYGLEVWQPKPSAVFVVYLVDAKTAAAITGEPIAPPVGYENYKGVWFGLEDKTLKDVAGSDKFSGLKSVAFPGDLSNIVRPKKAAKSAK